MQFTVQAGQAVHPYPLPSTLITIPTLVETPNIGNPKLFPLNEQEEPVSGNPIAVLIDGRHFDEPVTDLPRVGTTEAWYFQNLTADTHPIHIHLVEFQLEDRQLIDVDRFKAYWEKLNVNADGIPGELPLDHPPIRVNAEIPVSFELDPSFCSTTPCPARDFLFDTQDGAHDGPPFTPSVAIPPSPHESGWKDVFLAPHGIITRIRIRLAPQEVKEADLFPGKNTFPFDPTDGPGYVWHCHILDHEDNDMMRPMKIVNDLEPCLNCGVGPEATARNNTAPGSSTAAEASARNSAPATTQPAHNHNGSTSTTGQQMNKGVTPSPMPMPLPEQQK